MTGPELAAEHFKTVRNNIHPFFSDYKTLTANIRRSFQVRKDQVSIIVCKKMEK